ncbi:hypothetical protein ACHHV8_26775 [Paenibacillus sp. TAB 01]|uniref:hypothetical protein n=1 Tax=Paenibacillus sp. TAB 01 TaxID=3368988 RepID=UPI0037509594
MKLTTRIYLDAALQNMKSVTFFTFLQVLIARLGASNFEIALSNSLPPLFCALSLAFITRQLPLTRGVFLTSGYIRQFAFLCMAFSVLLPHPIPYLLFFWFDQCDSGDGYRGAAAGHYAQMGCRQRVPAYLQQ